MPACNLMRLLGASSGHQNPDSYKGSYNDASVKDNSLQTPKIALPCGYWHLHLRPQRRQLQPLNPLQLPYRGASAYIIELA